MSLTVSDPIPVKVANTGRHNLRVIACAKERRVTLFVRVHGLPTTIELDLASARALRAALPSPSAQ